MKPLLITLASLGVAGAALTVSAVPAAANSTIGRWLASSTSPAPSAAVSSTRMPILAGPRQLPAATPAAQSFTGAASSVAGNTGSRLTAPSVMGTFESGSVGSAIDIGPQAFGTLRHPFTTKNAFGSATSAPTNSYPWRATGKLWMRFGSSWFVCTASMIKKGIAVTAAHCVHNYGRGASGWPNRVIFEPARHFTSYPYGWYEASYIRIPTVYYNGTDNCTVRGVVCENDLAVLSLRPKSGLYPGNRVGWYGYGTNGYGYTSFLGRTAAQLTALGYPASLNTGRGMMRTDSLGYYATPNNVLMGSDQSGGSSGGPWIVNFGMDPSRSGNPLPSANAANIVMATTSWGYTSLTQKVQGASRFGNNSRFTSRTNIGALVADVCAATPAAC